MGRRVVVGRVGMVFDWIVVQKCYKTINIGRLYLKNDSNGKINHQKTLLS